MSIQTPPKRSRSWLVGTALGVLIALLIAPMTRWLVSAQFALAVPTPASVAPYSDIGIESHYFGVKLSSADRAYAQRTARLVAERHPDDLQMQIADAVTHQPETGALDSFLKVQRLEALTARFPDRPSLYANLLRYMSQGAVSLNRDEQYLLTGDTPPKNNPYHDNDTPEELDAFDRYAATGEQLDPANAYFPFLRAIGLFAARRDTEALDAIHRAAAKTRWQEYYTDELEGEWRQQQEAFGNRGAIPRVATAAAILFPHYSRLRSVARIATYEAAQAERAGHTEEGLAIRHDVIRCGSLMRAQSTSVIGSLVGIAITRTAMQRPDGAPPISDTQAKNGQTATRQHEEDVLRQRLDAYTAYLRRIGHADEIEQVRGEDATGEQVRSLARRMADISFVAPAKRVLLWWMVDLMALSNLLWLLLFGGMAALLAYNPRIRAGLGLPNYAQKTVFLGLIAALLTVPLYSEFSHGSWCLWTGGLLGALILAFPAKTARDRLRRLGVFVLSMGITSLLIWLYTWQLSGSLLPAEFYGLILGGGEGAQSFEFIWPSLLAGLTPIVPLLALLIIGIVSRACRVPLSVGLVRGCRGIVVPLSCAMFLAYGGLILFTVRAEAAAQYSLTRTVQSEGRYMAELAGQKWPGPIQKG